MPRTSSNSNPTGIVEINRQNVRIVVSDEGDTLAKITKLDLSSYNLPNEATIFCVARAGNTSNRIPVGTVGAWASSPFPLTELDRSSPMRFRLLVRMPDSPKLIASCENIRALDGEDAESLIPMEPADLGEQVWRVVALNDGPVLLFNPAVFPTAKAALQNPEFVSLVMPEALRQVCRALADNSDRLNDSANAWYGWRGWLERLGLEPYQEDDDADDEDADKRAWCDGVVTSFALFYRFATKLKTAMAKEVPND